MFTATIIHKQLMCPNFYMLHSSLPIHKYLPVHTHIYMYGNTAAKWLTCSKNSLMHIPSHTPTQRGEFWTQHHYPVRRYNTCKKAQRWAKAGKWRNNQGSIRSLSGASYEWMFYTCMYAFTSSESLDKICILDSILARDCTSSTLGSGSMPLLTISRKQSAALSLKDSRVR